jgi:hypothetical protein
MAQLKDGVKLKKVNYLKQNSTSHLFGRDYHKFLLLLQTSEAPTLKKPPCKSNPQDDIMKGILQGASRLRKVIVPNEDEKKEAK